MTLRRCTAEHPFGTIKAWMGVTLPDAAADERANGNGAQRSRLHIKPMISLVGVRRLLAAIPG
jgi:hypothetical protein